LDPDIVTELTGLPAYNYSVGKAFPEDYLAILRHIIARQDPKLIILQLDFYVFNENLHMMDEALANSGLAVYLKNNEGMTLRIFPSAKLFSLNALYYSFLVLYRHLSYIEPKPPAFKENGHRYPRQITHREVPVSNGYFESVVKDYVFSRKRINYLRTFAKIAKENKIRTIVVISPYYIKHLERMLADPVIPQKLAKFKRFAVEIFGEVIDFANVGVRAYVDPKDWADANHAAYELSSHILKIILGDVEDGEFGVVIKQVDVSLPLSVVDSLPWGG